MATGQQIFSLNDYYLKTLAGDELVTTRIGKGIAYLYGGTDGSSGQSSVLERFNYSSSTFFCQSRATGSIATYGGCGVSTTQDGWTANGWNPSPSATVTSVVQRVTFNNDTSMSNKTTCTLSTVMSRGVFNKYYGYICGASAPGTAASTVQRLLFSTDTTAPTAVGTLPAVNGSAGFTSGPGDGWLMAGSAGSSVVRLNFATDGSAAVAKGALTATRQGIASGNNGTDVLNLGGGGTTNTGTTLVDRFQLVSDLVNSVAKANLAGIIGQGGVANDRNSVYHVSGTDGVVTGSSNVFRVTYANDAVNTVTAGTFSVLFYDRGTLAA